VPGKSVYSEQAIGGKEKNIMRKRMIDSEMPVGRMKRVEDFLPPPDKLVMSDDMLRVTIYLRKASVDFFKRQAQRHHTKYQRMIREVVDRYTEKYQP
jgi:hypothetical protein